MRTAVAVTLIICGTILIAIPAMYDFLLSTQRFDLLSVRDDISGVQGGQPMSALYSFVCWMSGLAMIATAVVCSMKFPKVEAHPSPAVA